MSPTPNWTSQGSASESALSVLSLVASTTLVALLGSLYPDPSRVDWTLASAPTKNVAT